LQKVYSTEKAFAKLSCFWIWWI